MGSKRVARALSAYMGFVVSLYGRTSAELVSMFLPWNLPPPAFLNLCESMSRTQLVESLSDGERKLVSWFRLPGT